MGPKDAASRSAAADPAVSGAEVIYLLCIDWCRKRKSAGCGARTRCVDRFACVGTLRTVDNGRGSWRIGSASKEYTNASKCFSASKRKISLVSLIGVRFHCRKLKRMGRAFYAAARGRSYLDQQLKVSVKQEPGHAESGTSRIQGGSSGGYTPRQA